MNLKKVILSEIIDSNRPFTVDDLAFLELMYKENLDVIISMLEKEKKIKKVYYNEYEERCTSEFDEEAVISYVQNLSFNNGCLSD